MRVPERRRGAVARLRAVVIGALVAASLPPTGADAALRLDAPAMAVWYVNRPLLAVSVSGAGFGTWDHARAAGDVVEFDVLPDHAGSAAMTISLAATDPAIVRWDDFSVAATLSSSVIPLRARVVVGGQRTAGAPFEDYAYERFSTAANGGAPAGMAIDPVGRAWLTGEFQHTAGYWDPADRTVKLASSYPVPQGTPYFFSCYTTPQGQTICTSFPTPIYPDVVTTDVFGRIWLPESGGWGELFTLVPAVRNHSRLISFDTTTSALTARAYNIPGNNTVIFGAATAPSPPPIYLGTRVWYTQSAAWHSPAGPCGTPWDLYRHARLVAFDVSIQDGIGTPFDNGFTFTTTATCDPVAGEAFGRCSNASQERCLNSEDCVLANQICPPGSPVWAGCFHTYDLGADVGQPGLVTVHPDGGVWFAGFLSRHDHFGRLDPTTGTITRFMPTPPAWQTLTCASQPPLVVTWDVHTAHNGDMLGTGYGAYRIIRIPSANFTNPGCDQLVRDDGSSGACQYDAQGVFPACHNPCMQEFVHPGAPTVTNPTARTAPPVYVREDAQQRLWIGSAYFRTQDAVWIHFPPLIMLDDATPGDEARRIAGMGQVGEIDGSGTVWGLDFAGQRLTRLVAARCGDGVVDPGEECDDGNLVTGDGCEENCTASLCQGGLPLVNARVTVPLTSGSSVTRIIVKGEVTLPAGFDLAQLSAGIQVALASHATQGAWYEQTYRTHVVPPIGGPFCDPIGLDRWVHNSGSSRWSYRNVSNAAKPDCLPGTANGLYSASYVVRNGRLKVTVNIRNATVGTIDPNQVTATVVLGATRAAGTAGKCATATFTNCGRPGGLRCYQP